MASTDETRFGTFEKLNASNWHYWKFDMKMHLGGMDLWDIVEGTEVPEEDATDAERRKFKKRENKAHSVICLGVSNELKIYVRGSKNSKEAWESLTNHFEEKTLSSIIDLRRKLYDLKLDAAGDMVKHINTMKTTADQLEALEDPQSERDLVYILMSSVPSDYRTLLTTLETLKPDQLTWDYVRDRMITEHRRTKGHTVEDSESRHDELQDALFVGNRQKELKFRKCHYCDEKGHIVKECPIKRADVKRRLGIAEESAAFCNDGSLGENSESNSILGFSCEFALHSSVDQSEEDAWWLDSACSRHMTYGKSDFETLMIHETPIDVVLADNTVVKAVGNGNIRAIMKDANGRQVQMEFKDVLYVPNLKKRLISIPQMTERGAEITFKKRLCTLFYKKRRFKLGEKVGKLYRLHCQIVSSSRKSVTCVSNQWETVAFGDFSLKDTVLSDNDDLVYSASGSVGSMPRRV